jgi:16S rRNA processing protein RimM
MTEEFITLARVIKTQGRNGEVGVELHSDVPGRFQAGLRVFALAGNGARRELQVEEAWPHKGHLILKFQGVDSISGAEELLDCELQVPRSERARLEAGWTYVSDLIGCTVLDGDHEVGRIQEVRFGAGEAPLLVVKGEVTGHREYEIPFAQAYLVEVDLSRKQVRMQIPDGMLAINAPVTEEEKRQQGGRTAGKRQR